MGLKFHGSLSQVLEQRADFIRNIQMGGNRITFSLASLRYYISCITEPFAVLNIFGNIGLFAMLSFFGYFIAIYWYSNRYVNTHGCFQKQYIRQK